MARWKEKLPEMYVERMAEVIKVLGHTYRLQIIEHLDLNGEQPVHQILAAIGGNQAALSQHLNKMRRAGIIKAVRRGKEVWYGIADEDSLTILGCMRKRFDKLLHGGPLIAGKAGCAKPGCQ